MIGITIKKLLKANSELVALVPESSWYPYIANEGTPLPLIIYTIDSLDPEYTKDGWSDDNCSFSIKTYSNDYSSLQDISAQVRLSFECQRDTSTRRIEMTGQKEGYDIMNDCFVNEINFKTKLITL